MSFLLLPPLRDVQLAPPAAVCPLCGEEQYREDRMVRRRGQLVCSRCARRKRRSGGKETRGS